MSRNSMSSHLNQLPPGKPLTSSPSHSLFNTRISLALRALLCKSDKNAPAERPFFKACFLRKHTGHSEGCLPVFAAS